MRLSQSEIQASVQQRHQQTNSNTINNNNSQLSLSTVSTLVGTGAAATGATVTVPGVLRTRNQSKCLSDYLLITDMRNLGKACKHRKYTDLLEGLRSDIIQLLQRRELNENQYKMLDDRIIEYLNKISNMR